MPEMSNPPNKRARLPSVAYFCMEYAVDEDLQLYAGGLGILAGDMVKQAQEESRPMTFLGLLWDEGYSCQELLEGVQIKMVSKKLDRSKLEKMTLKKDVFVEIKGKQVQIDAYKVKAYPNLILMEPTKEEDRKLTKRLYQNVDTNEDRLAQELILGRGGVRVLRAIEKQIDVYHFNEGHALFAAFELLSENMIGKQPLTFDEALQVVKKSVLFTTHTPVMAGNECHDLQVVSDMIGQEFTKQQLENVGGWEGTAFNMTVGALRICYKCNGVAELHGQTANKMWKSVKNKAEIVSITNGVHQKSWQHADIQTEDVAKLWETHQKAKKELLGEVKARTNMQLKDDVLLIGFARRAATYKRHMLVLEDEKVMEPLFSKGKIQILFAGKAHPEDKDGQKSLEKIREFEKRYPKSVVYVPNYDMKLGRLLTAGCDVWLNNPRRPMEASGTSGMKAALNGVLNCSVMDGWWPEACKDGENGWQFGDCYEGEDDSVDRNALLKTIQEKIVPTYYEKSDEWKKMMKSSIKMAEEQFTTKRMMKEYYSLYNQSEA